MQWEHLLCSTRLSTLEQAHDTPPSATRNSRRSPFNQDYGRVLYSSAFRHLQDKTQVFPLGRNDYVRTRLTHSLEVANVGRGLAVRLADIIREREPESAARCPLHCLGDIVATACLAHDIGNPPFGHSGEEAITAALAGTPYEGFLFEGNAQGLRVLCHSGDSIRHHGMDLTVATLGAFAKYPCTEPGERYKKFGIYHSEADTFAKVAEQCELPPLGKHSWARHPLAYLMEAADDISYLIADVEDAYVSGLISFDEARELLCSLHGEESHRQHSELSPDATIRMARAIAVGRCMDDITDALETHYDAIMAGQLGQSLLQLVPDAARDAYNHVKQFSIRRIYQAPSVVQVEVTGFQVLRALMELFLTWVENPHSALGRKLAQLLPPGAAEQQEQDARFRHLIDYLSGMTDSDALLSYRRLFGISGGM
ncbi:MAG: dGTP triphosphohydrolase [Akkermansia sp.]